MRENEVEKATRDFMYQFAKAIGVVWLVEKLPFLELKPQYKERRDNEK